MYLLIILLPATVAAFPRTVAHRIEIAIATSDCVVSRVREREENQQESNSVLLRVVHPQARSVLESLSSLPAAFRTSSSIRSLSFWYLDISLVIKLQYIQRPRATAALLLVSRDTREALIEI